MLRKRLQVSIPIIPFYPCSEREETEGQRGEAPAKVTQVMGHRQQVSSPAHLVPGSQMGNSPRLERLTDLLTEPHLSGEKRSSSLVMYKCFTYEQKRPHICPSVPSSWAGGLSMPHTRFPTRYCFLQVQAGKTFSRASRQLSHRQRASTVLPNEAELTVNI